MMHKKQDPEEKDWEYGDAWKRGAPEEAGPAEDVQYVEILRGDIGRGFDDTFMLDLISYLGASGIRATYDSIAIGLEMGIGATKTYVLKVEVGREEEARKLLEEKLK